MRLSPLSPLKPINLVMVCSTVILMLAVIAWVTSRVIGPPILHTVGTILFVIGIIVAFAPLIGVLAVFSIKRLHDQWGAIKGTGAYIDESGLLR